MRYLPRFAQRHKGHINRGNPDLEASSESLTTATLAQQDGGDVLLMMMPQQVPDHPGPEGLQLAGEEEGGALAPPVP